MGKSFFNSLLPKILWYSHFKIGNKKEDRILSVVIDRIFMVTDTETFIKEKLENLCVYGRRH